MILLNKITRKLVIIFSLLCCFVAVSAQSGMIDLDYKIMHPTACNQVDGEIHITPLNGIAPYEYSIDGGASFQTDSVFTGLSIGTYIIFVRDAQKKISSYKLARLEADGSPSIRGIVMANPMICSEGGTLKILAENGIGDLLYSIDNGVTFQANHIFSNVEAGTYNIIVQNADSTCAATYPTITFEPVEPSEFLNINVTSTNPGCDSTNGSILINVTGGSGDYLYSINSGLDFQGSNTFENLGEGSYDLIIVDTLTKCGKEVSQDVVLSTEGCMTCDSLSITVAEIHPDCDSLNGQIDISVSGGSGTYEYSINNGQNYVTNAVFEGLAADTYMILVRDVAMDCEKAADNNITLEDQNCPTCDSLSITVTEIHPDCDSLNGQIAIVVNGGSDNYEYSINNGQAYFSSAVFEGLSADTYTVLVRDVAMDCEKAADNVITLEDMNCFSCDSLQSQTFIQTPSCDSLDGRIELSTTGGSGAYLYSMNNGIFQTENTFANLGEGDYVFTVRDTVSECDKMLPIINLVSENCDTCPTLSLLGTGASIITLNDCDANAVFCFEGLSKEEMAAYQILDNGSPYTGSIEDCVGQSSNSFAIQLDTGVHQIQIIQTGNDCETTFDLAVRCLTDTIRIDTTIEVGQSDTICFEDLFMGEIVAITPICEGQSPDVGFEINNNDNCLIYEGRQEGQDTICLEVCLMDNTCKEVIITVTVIDSTCADLFPATATVEAAHCDSTTYYCLGILRQNLGLYDFFLDGQAYTGTFVDCDVPNEVAIGGVTVGNYEFIAVLKGNDCADTISINVICESEHKEFRDTVMVNEIDTFCLDTSTFAGNIISIRNVCEDLSGERVMFEIDTMNYCISYLGMEVGEETACIEVCDDLQKCDTTDIIITVVPEEDTIPLPIAIDDLDTLESGGTTTINVLGNDTTNSTLITVTIIDDPRHGTATVNPDMTITYTTTDTTCNEVDSFIYELCNPSGCDTATVEIFIECKVFKIYNGFSPNNDNVNETFMIDGIEDFPNNHLIILNRWGNRVYEQSGYKGQWDGTWNNQKLPDGTYFYMLDDGAGKQYSGFLQIRR